MSQPPEDWAAVGRCIDQRLTELAWTQRELATRSLVSQAIVRELQYNTNQRRRSPRTLEALSTALQLHPDHLSMVLNSHTPPPPPATPNEDNPFSARLAVLEQRMTEIANTLHELRIDLALILHNTRPRVPSSNQRDSPQTTWTDGASL
nr:helix-turn-helix transcriptional regulator [Actinokineospora terrae]